MHVRAVIVLRVAAAALAAAFGAMHVLSVRYDETWEVAWNGPSPPQYGWPLPWTAWNGVSSFEWIVSPLPLVVDLLVYAVPFALLGALVEWFVKRRPGAASRALRAAVALGAVAMTLPGLLTLLFFFEGAYALGTLSPFREPRAQVWVGFFESCPDSRVVPTPVSAGGSFGP